MNIQQILDSSKQALIAIFTVAFLSFTSSAWAAITVTTTADCVAGTTAGGCPTGFMPAPGSLRAAIVAANATPALDEIDFNIPSAEAIAGKYTIKPLSALPTITQPVFINGEMVAMGWTSRLTGTSTGVENEIPANLVIEIDGTLAPVNSNGLVLNNTGSTIKGLVINGFSGNSNLISISGGGQYFIQGNYLGTNAAGTSSKSNNIRAININSSSNNLIGGMNPADRNVISSQGRRGIQTNTVTNTKILGNLIGPAANVNLPAIGNSELGVFMFSESNGAQIEGNIFDKNGRAIDIFATGAAVNQKNLNLLIKNNVIRNSIRAGISFDGNIGASYPLIAPNTIIEGNTLYNNPYGLVIESFKERTAFPTMRDVHVLNNIIYNGEVGILLTTANDVELKGNEIYGFGHYGIVIGADSTAINVRDNQIYNNKQGVLVGAARLQYREFVTGGVYDTDQPEIGPLDVIFKHNRIYNNDQTGILVGSQFTACAAGCQVNDNNLIFPFPILSFPPFFDPVVPRDSDRITISENEIYSNGLLGIDITKEGGTEPPFLINTPPPTVPPQGRLVFPIPDGINVNDYLDSDPFANHFQNFPELIWAKSWNGFVRIHGQLYTEPFKKYRIEFFANKTDKVDASNYGEGQCFLGAYEVDTNNEGHSVLDTKNKFEIALGAGKCNVMLGDYVTATATELVPDSVNGYQSGSTSEFSQAVLVTQ